MTTVHEGIGKLPGDWERYLDNQSYIRHIPNLDPYSYAMLFARGYFPVEREDGFSILMSKYHEYIPVTFHIPHGVAKALRKDEFTFSTNRHCAYVIAECAIHRANADWDEQWMGERARRNLRVLHRDGVAHSVEVYRKGELAGGLVGLAMGGLFIGLSIYSRQDEAGHVGLVALKAILCRRNFLALDAMAPSNSSRLFGGNLLRAQHDYYLRRRALAYEDASEFPTFTSKLSINKFIAPLQNG